jgi:hypothetical protein
MFEKNMLLKETKIKIHIQVRDIKQHSMFNIMRLTVGGK